MATELTLQTPPGRVRHSFNDIVDRGERLAAMQRTVTEKFMELDDPAAWVRFADGLARFPQLSPANVLLVMDQHPDAQHVHTHRGWLALERQPIERGVAVLVPSVRQVRENGRTVWDGGRPVVEEVRQRPATLFDYTSTAGAHIPRPWEERTLLPPEGLLDDLRAAAASIGYAVEARRDAAPAGRRVFALIHGQDDARKVRTLAWDLGAVAGGVAGAELFAYALCMANGMEMPVPDYPRNPRGAVVAAGAGLRRVLQRTTFRGLRR